jgi:hypothetical protein
MANWVKCGLATAAVGLAGASWASGQQVIERDTKLTGPRGRTIERDIRVERGPGYVDRKIEIKRPGETLIRDTRIENGRGGHPGHPHPTGHGPGPGFGGPPRVIERDFVVERDVVVQRPPLFSTFVGVPFFNLFLGNASPPPPPPPPVLYYPEPVFAPPPPPMVVYPQPQPPVVVEAPPPTPADPLSDALGRLKSYHNHSRRDGALTLGRIGDDRAVGPLMDRLEHDGEKEVRVAAAWALGEIADERSALALQRVALNDRKHEVREAATIAYRKLPRPGQFREPASGPIPVQPQGRMIRSSPEVLDPGPGLSGRPDPEDRPPPPPVPSTGPVLEGPTTPSPFRNPS